MPDVDVFKIEVVPDYLEEITVLLTAGHCPEGYTTT